MTARKVSVWEDVTVCNRGSRRDQGLVAGILLVNTRSICIAFVFLQPLRQAAVFIPTVQVKQGEATEVPEGYVISLRPHSWQLAEP